MRMRTKKYLENSETSISIALISMSLIYMMTLIYQIDICPYYYTI